MIATAISEPCAPGNVPMTSSPLCPIAVETGSPGISEYGIRVGVFERLGECAQPAAENDADLWPERGFRLHETGGALHLLRVALWL